MKKDLNYFKDQLALKLKFKNWNQFRFSTLHATGALNQHNAIKYYDEISDRAATLFAEHERKEARHILGIEAKIRAEVQAADSIMEWVVSVQA